jgi:Endomembrane protein 70
MLLCSKELTADEVAKFRRVRCHLPQHLWAPRSWAASNLACASFLVLNRWVHGRWRGQLRRAPTGKCRDGIPAAAVPSLSRATASPPGSYIRLHRQCSEKSRRACGTDQSTQSTASPGCCDTHTSGCACMAAQAHSARHSYQTHLMTAFQKSRVAGALCASHAPCACMQAVAEDYYVQMYYDDLPIYGIVGKTEKLLHAGKPTFRYYLYTHTHFEVHYNGNNVIQVVMPTPSEPVDVSEDVMPHSGSTLPVEFTYSVSWYETSVPFSKRLDHYDALSRNPIHLEVRPSCSCPARTPHSAAAPPHSSAHAAQQHPCGAARGQCTTSQSAQRCSARLGLCSVAPCTETACRGPPGMQVVRKLYLCTHTDACNMQFVFHWHAWWSPATSPATEGQCTPQHCQRLMCAPQREVPVLERTCLHEPCGCKSCCPGAALLAFARCTLHPVVARSRASMPSASISACGASISASGYPHAVPCLWTREAPRTTPAATCMHSASAYGTSQASCDGLLRQPPATASCDMCRLRRSTGSPS